MQARRLILIDPDDAGRQMMAERLRMQLYDVTAFAGPAEGAVTALSNPPSAVVADLWMPGISGVQLCRLLRAEPSTESVPVVLRGPDDQRNRFWAERAGASAYVVKGRMGDLLRALSRAIAAAPAGDAFFTHLSGEATEIRDRIAASLDQALFDSVIAAEVRALGTCGEFTSLFDMFTQFLCQVMSYRWVALTTNAPVRLSLHAHPARRQEAEKEARAALALGPECPALVVEDEDAALAAGGPDPVVLGVRFADLPLGRLALAPCVPLEKQDHSLMAVIARELGGPMRMASLVEEAQRQATVDALTTLLNRRAFLGGMELELERASRLGYPISVVLLDVDHFKQVNDSHGHAVGDTVLSAVGRMLRTQLRKVDLAARWGGEEFVVALSGTPESGAVLVAERLRVCFEKLFLRTSEEKRVPVTASFGLSQWRRSEPVESLIDRADRAMYAAKSAGRNRVAVAPAELGAAGAPEVEIIGIPPPLSDQSADSLDV